MTRSERYPPLLIVNADDFGLSEGINRAVVRGHGEGVITSATLIAAGEAFEHAVRLATTVPRLGVGVHLCLHREAPVLPPNRIPSLTNDTGRLRTRAQVLRGLAGGTITAGEVEAEFAAQVARVRDAGIAITHLDSHAHLHAIPKIGAIAARVASRFGIRWIRRAEAWNWMDYAGARLGRMGVAAAITLCHAFSSRRWKHTLRMPDRFLGLPRSGQVSASWLCRVLTTLRSGTITELMVHPGDGSPAALPADDHGPESRRREYEAVRSPQVLDTVRARGIRLIRFGSEVSC